MTVDGPWDLLRYNTTSTDDFTIFTVRSHIHLSNCFGEHFVHVHSVLRRRLDERTSPDLSERHSLDGWDLALAL